MVSSTPGDRALAGAPPALLRGEVRTVVVRKAVAAQFGSDQGDAARHADRNPPHGSWFLQRLGTAPLPERRLLYYAAKFGQWWSARQLRHSSDLIKATLPGMQTETLPTDHGFFNAWGPRPCRSAACSTTRRSSDSGGPQGSCGTVRI